MYKKVILLVGIFSSIQTYAQLHETIEMPVPNTNSQMQQLLAQKEKINKEISTARELLKTFSQKWPQMQEDIKKEFSDQSKAIGIINSIALAFTAYKCHFQHLLNQVGQINQRLENISKKKIKIL